MALFKILSKKKKNVKTHKRIKQTEERTLIMIIINTETLCFVNDNGESTVCDILFLYVTERGKIIVFTDNSIDHEGFTQAYAGVYNPSFDANRLLPITNSKDWDTIELLLEALTSKNNE